tara:strand:- start:198 stop:410 length:213 start_codon:yes stop_codon:yes gene_type:complete
MGNMSYCRFENTARDLRDCVRAIERGQTDDMSNYEAEGLEDLLSLSQEIVNMEDEIKEVLERHLKEMMNS